MSQYAPDPYGPPPSNVDGKLKPPAICLIIVGVLSLLWYIFNLIMNILALAGVIQPEPIEFGGQTSQSNPGMGVVVSIAMLAANAAVILGAVNMIKKTGWGLAMTGAVLAVIPCISPCCVLGIPFGIWAIIILVNQDVKAAFN